MRQIQPAVGQNFLAGMVGGVQAGQQMRQASDQNALRNLLAGADLNDPDLAAQVAQYDPQMGMQMNQQDYQRERQGRADARADQQFAMQVQAHAAQMSQMERQQAAQEIRQGLMPFAVAHRQGAAQFEAVKARNAAVIEAAGIDPASVTYENFPSVAAQFEGIAEVFEAADSIVPEAPKDPASIQALRIRAQEAGLKEGTPEYAQFMANGGVKKDGLRIETRPDGSTVVTQGGSAGADASDVTSPSSPAAMIASIDGILNDPALDYATGWLEWTQKIPGTASMRFGARAKQLQGQAFLQAFESLKGGGHITEIEGQKATDAIGRLTTAQSPEDYRDALMELRGLLQLGIEREGGKAPERAQGQIPDFSTMSDDDLDAYIREREGQ